MPSGSGRQRPAPRPPASPTRSGRPPRPPLRRRAPSSGMPLNMTSDWPLLVSFLIPLIPLFALSTLAYDLLVELPERKSYDPYLPMKERADKLESWREKEKLKAQKKAQHKELLRKKISLWVAEDKLEQTILDAITHITPL
ncbi:hypothetical protein ABZP36_013185 [Zizania latifolia]